MTVGILRCRECVRFHIYPDLPVLLSSQQAACRRAALRVWQPGVLCQHPWLWCRRQPSLSRQLSSKLDSEVLVLLSAGSVVQQWWHWAAAQWLPSWATACSWLWLRLRRTMRHQGFHGCIPRGKQPIPDWWGQQLDLGWWCWLYIVHQCNIAGGELSALSLVLYWAFAVAHDTQAQTIKQRVLSGTKFVLTVSFKTGFGNQAPPWRSIKFWYFPQARCYLVLDGSEVKKVSTA